MSNWTEPLFSRRGAVKNAEISAKYFKEDWFPAEGVIKMTKNGIYGDGGFTVLNATH